ITLTLAGPPRWPLPGAVPEGVRFLGAVPLERVRALYREHDLFVMPSRFEPFGIVFAEALAHGLPCVGRDHFAMPELIVPGVGGALIENDDPDDLARAIAATLADDELYAACRGNRTEIARRYSWDSVATAIVRQMAGVGG